MKLAFFAHEMQLPATPVCAVEADRDVDRVSRATGLRAHRLEADIAAEGADSVSAVYIGKIVLRRGYLHFSPLLVGIRIGVFGTNLGGPRCRVRTHISSFLAFGRRASSPLPRQHCQCRACAVCHHRGSGTSSKARVA